MRAADNLTPVAALNLARIEEKTRLTFVQLMKGNGMLILFGLKNCDTCRKASKALEAAGHDVSLRDVRDDPLDKETISRFLEIFGDNLLNTRSTTWRGLSAAERSRPPADLLADYPALMKRPVIDDEGKLTLGWDKSVQSLLLG